MRKGEAPISARERRLYGPISHAALINEAKQVLIQRGICVHINTKPYKYPLRNLWRVLDIMVTNGTSLVRVANVLSAENFQFHVKAKEA